MRLQMRENNFPFQLGVTYRRCELGWAIRRGLNRLFTEFDRLTRVKRAYQGLLLRTLPENDARGRPVIEFFKVHPIVILRISEPFVRFALDQKNVRMLSN